MGRARTGPQPSLALVVVTMVASATVLGLGRRAAGAAWPAANKHVQCLKRESGRPRRSALPPPGYKRPRGRARAQTLLPSSSSCAKKAPLNLLAPPNPLEQNPTLPQ
ncbi:hypothetical protein NDU88_004477 [Pleurodeles waltl]|uniref:Uncharacterized protein n=1 Tax=Pleurodeles waltl TaxID=8319 RepID=A0AAV7QF30_PLEWA|nr:hypothetical protein NDU88_004477 [Pleurodeles waltl]